MGYVIVTPTSIVVTATDATVTQTIGVEIEPSASGKVRVDAGFQQEGILI